MKDGQRRSKKWLVFGGLFVATLALIIGISTKFMGSNQVANQGETPTPVKTVSPLTDAESDRLAKLATSPLPTPTTTPPSLPVNSPDINGSLPTNNTPPVINNPTKTPVSPEPIKTPVVPQRKISSGEKYPEAVPVDNPASRKYRSIAQQTGYLETYPQLPGSIMGTSNGQRVVRDGLNAFSAMAQKAAGEGISLKILSGFRDIQTQVGIFERKGGGVSAAEYSAPPGHSQHHTGLAIDINSLSPSFRNTPAYRWLKKNAPSYGFMLSYENSQGDLGPNNEPWHWVYVKDPKAMRLMTCFITRAKSIGYDPLQGDGALNEIYQQSISESPTCPNS